MTLRVVAVDWSGRLTGAQESLWLAEVREGRLTDLYNGLDRKAAIERIVEIANEEPRTVIGLDFAFSFPRWWCEQNGWQGVKEVWSAMAEDGEGLLSACREPLWGRPGRSNPHPPDRRFRRTDREVGGAKSVFQIGGAGAVGTGSIRGMPHLLTLADRGFDVWPFCEAGWPRVIEIYPRAFSGPVKKKRWRERITLLKNRFADQSSELTERAAGSEDAFDAAVSAVEMAAHQGELAALQRNRDRDYAIEGRIWVP